MTSPSDYSDSDLKQIIENYREQVEVVNIVGKKKENFSQKRKPKKKKKNFTN